MSTKKLLQDSFGAVLKRAGFSRKAASWHRRNGDVVQILNLQKSAGSQFYFVNLAWWFASEGSTVPPFYQAHIQSRWETILPLDAKYVEKLLYFEEKPETTAERVVEATSLLEKYVVPFFDATSTVEQLRTIHQERRWPGGFGLSKEALTLLGENSGSAGAEFNGGL